MSSGAASTPLASTPVVQIVAGGYPRGAFAGDPVGLKCPGGLDLDCCLDPRCRRRHHPEVLLARKRILSGACPDLPFGDLIGVDDAPHADAARTMCALVEQSVLRVWNKSRCMYQTNGTDPNGPNEFNPRQKLEALMAAVESKRANPADDRNGNIQIAGVGRLLCDALCKVRQASQPHAWCNFVLALHGKVRQTDASTPHPDCLSPAPSPCSMPTI